MDLFILCEEKYILGILQKNFVMNVDIVIKFEVVKLG
jgi:hypothetical protein